MVINGLATRRTGQGEPVVLVHGSSGGLDSWDPVVPLLADGFELWSYARRGYAPSAGCVGLKSFADDVADLRAIVDAAGGSAHVVGASYGAAVGLHAALSDISGIRSLTVFEPPLYAAGAKLGDVRDRFRALAAAGDLASAMRLFAAEVAQVPAAILDALPAGDPDPAEAEGCRHDLEAMAADSTDIGRWAAIRVPVLIMQGGDTWAPMPATMDALAEALPAAERVVLAGQAHFATHTAPAEFAAGLRRFLDG